jgi:hypothetical protein
LHSNTESGLRLPRYRPPQPPRASIYIRPPCPPNASITPHSLSPQSHCSISYLPSAHLSSDQRLSMVLTKPPAAIDDDQAEREYLVFINGNG